MTKNVVVTGGAGYIGSHACNALKKAGFVPVTFDNLSTGWRDSVKFGPFEYGDLLNSSDIDKVLDKYSPIAIMHFAGLSQVGESIINPKIYWENNVVGSLNLVNSAIKYNCMNFVFSSTCATYGEQDNVLLEETSDQLPINAYGRSKCAVENILNDFEIAHGLRYVTFRYFNVAGANIEAKIGEYHQPESHLIPLLLNSIDQKRDLFTIYGMDYDTPDGTCVRDYIHVSDLVDAHILGIKWLLNGKISRVFNLGTGHGFSVLEVIEAVKNVTNKNVAVKEGVRRTGDCTKLVSNSKRAKEELGWTPRKSDLKRIISDSWFWHQNVSYSKENNIK